MAEFDRDVASLAARVRDGSMVAVPPDYSGVAVALTRALVQRGVRGLHLVCTPSTGIQGDMLIGAGCVDIVESAAVTLGEHGTGPRFAAAVKAGTVRLLDGTCPAIHAALQAAEKGVPFLPIRGILGSDLMANRTDWKVIDNPFSEQRDPIVLVPALHPDYALFHALMADEEGNVWVGRRREVITLAHAARETLVTVERRVPGSLLDDERTAAGVLPSVYVTALAVAEQGAWPLGLLDGYEADLEAVGRYARAAATEAGFRAWLAEPPSRIAAE